VPAARRLKLKRACPVESNSHNASLLICQESGVLAAVVETLRKESGSLLRRGDNMIDLSAVCRDWRSINRSCAEEWLEGLRKTTRFDWQITNFSGYLRNSVHNTNLLDSPQFLRGSSNFRLAIGFMDGRQMNSEGAWLPLSECPRFAEPPSHLCISLAIADKSFYTGSTGPIEVTFTLRHRDPRFNIQRRMCRTFCWGTCGAEFDAATGRSLYRWSHAILNFCALDTIRSDRAGYMLDDTLSISVDIEPPKPPEPKPLPPPTPTRKRPPTRATPAAEDDAVHHAPPPSAKQRVVLAE